MASSDSTTLSPSCPLCLQTCSEPVVLSCSHRFCKPCMDTLWTGIPKRECPVCGRRSSLEWLPPSITLEPPIGGSSMFLELLHSDMAPEPPIFGKSRSLELLHSDMASDIALEPPVRRRRNSFPWLPPDMASDMASDMAPDMAPEYSFCGRSRSLRWLPTFISEPPRRHSLCSLHREELSRCVVHRDEQRQQEKEQVEQKLQQLQKQVQDLTLKLDQERKGNLELQKKLEHLRETSQHLHRELLRPKDSTLSFVDGEDDQS